MEWYKRKFRKSISQNIRRKKENMREEIYAFYRHLRQNRRHSEEYVLVCTFKMTKQIAPELTLEEFEELIKEFTKKYFEENERKVR